MTNRVQTQMNNKIVNLINKVDDRTRIFRTWRYHEKYRSISRKIKGILNSILIGVIADIKAKVK
jgi:hypothetical protein